MILLYILPLWLRFEIIAAVVLSTFRQTKCSVELTLNNSSIQIQLLYVKTVFIRFADIKPNQIRCGEHSDYGSITLLFQDDAGGLEVPYCLFFKTRVVFKVV